MLKHLSSFFTVLRRSAVRSDASLSDSVSCASAPTQSVACAESAFMDEVYHHGLCKQGRIALNIDSTQQQRWPQIVLDAIAVILWGGSLFGMMWLGVAAGF